MSELSLVVSPGKAPGTVLTTTGESLAIPTGWALLPPGDAGLTRRVKAAGPSWTVQVTKGRKKFSQGVWAPAANIENARAGVEAERATESYAKRREADANRRERKQDAYVEDFCAAVLQFLNFAPAHQALAQKLAEAITIHATPVGSGTVARTQRIPIEQRAEAAVIAWMRHQTTSYDHMKIARVKGERREVRQELAAISRKLLDRYRRGAIADPSTCPLQQALKALPPG
jgi:hypothetical protein